MEWERRAKVNEAPVIVSLELVTLTALGRAGEL
jgi:hypothetical protein